MMETLVTRHSRQIKNILIFCSVILVLIVLKQAKEIFIPLAIALFIFAFVNPLMGKLDSLKVPKTISIVIVMALLIVSVSVFFYIVLMMTNMLAEGLPFYVERIASLDHLISSYIIQYIEGIPQDFSLLASININWYSFAMSFLTGVTNQFVAIVSDLVLIFIFVLFMLLERTTFIPKVTRAFSSERKDKFVNILDRANKQMGKYLYIKVVISALTGLCFYLTAIITGLDFALVWGVLAFIFNFIPTIGSIVITAMTIAMAVIQFLPNWMLIIYVAVLAVLIQQVLGSIIDPKLQGVQLNISPLIILVSLSLWGYIWGIVGMFLAVPLTSMIQILCTVMPPLRPIAIFLSTGKNYLKEQESSKKKNKKNIINTANVDDFVLPEGDNPEGKK